MSDIIALRSVDREVFWHPSDDTSGLTLFEVMGEWLAHGITFTILEYHPKSSRFDKSGRCLWWDEQLRNLGYDIHEPI